MGVYEFCIILTPVLSIYITVIIEVPLTRFPEFVSQIELGKSILRADL